MVFLVQRGAVDRGAGQGGHRGLADRRLAACTPAKDDDQADRGQQRTTEGHDRAHDRPGRLHTLETLSPREVRGRPGYSPGLLAEAETGCREDGSAAPAGRRVARTDPASTSRNPSPIPTVKLSCSTATPRIAATAGLT